MKPRWKWGSGWNNIWRRRTTNPAQDSIEGTLCGAHCVASWWTTCNLAILNTTWKGKYLSEFDSLFWRSSNHDWLGQGDNNCGLAQRWECPPLLWWWCNYFEKGLEFNADYIKCLSALIWSWKARRKCVFWYFPTINCGLHCGFHNQLWLAGILLPLLLLIELFGAH